MLLMAEGCLGLCAFQSFRLFPGSSIGAFIIGIGFGVYFFFYYNEEPLKPYSNYLGPYML